MFSGILKQAESAVQQVQQQVNQAVGGKKSRAGPTDASGRPISEAQFIEQTQAVIKGDVILFSGCKDEQTSADVSNVASFGLPRVSAAESAGGACTNSLLSVMKDQQDITYADLLVKMQSMLKTKGYQQVPQLSTSRHVNDLRQKRFSVMNPRSSGRTRAVLIGINYTGQKGELNGCVNDVKMMKNFITSKGFNDAPSHMRILTDDPQFAHAAPTARNIIEALQWLVQGAAAGDSLFVHYSGHGSQLPDDNGDEADGYDETLVPVDYQTSGQIRDDTLFKILVAPLPEGVSMTCVFDCCHSGTILDLPFIFTADPSGCAQLSNSTAPAASTGVNNDFNFAAVVALIADVARGLFSGFDEVHRTIEIQSRGLRNLVA